MLPPIPQLPTPLSPIRPMTCEWLDGDNCWKELMRDVVACAPNGFGTVASDGSACRFPDGSRLEYTGDFDACEPLPANEGGSGGEANTTSTIIVANHDVRRPDGSRCFSAKIQGFGRASYSSATQTILTTATGLFTFQLTCPDGSTYDSGAEGACPSLAAYWARGQLPGELFFCNADSSEYFVAVSGVDQARANVASCRQ